MIQFIKNSRPGKKGKKADLWIGLVWGVVWQRGMRETLGVGENFICGSGSGRSVCICQNPLNCTLKICELINLISETFLMNFNWEFQCSAVPQGCLKWWWKFSRSVVANSWDHVDCSPPGSSVDGILQARILEWIAIHFSRASSWARDRTRLSCTAGRFSMTELRGS